MDFLHSAKYAVEHKVQYDGNMALVNGLYYKQNDVVYLCIRSTGVPVYNDLAELVDVYVELA